MNQASFYCLHCNQRRLFQSKPMNHTPHILASVFLCGLYLPIWILIAITDKPQWHCSVCGYSAPERYLMDPTLADREQNWNFQKVADEAAAREARGEDQTIGEKITYFIDDHRQPLIVGGIIAGVLGVAIISGTMAINRRQAEIDAKRLSQTPTPTATVASSPTQTPKRNKR